MENLESHGLHNYLYNIYDRWSDINSDESVVELSDSTRFNELSNTACCKKPMVEDQVHALSCHSEIQMVDYSSFYGQPLDLSKSGSFRKTVEKEQEPQLVEMHVITDLDKLMVEKSYSGKPMVENQPTNLSSGDGEASSSGCLPEKSYSGKPMVENQPTNLSSGEAFSSEFLLTSNKTAFGNAWIKNGQTRIELTAIENSTNYFDQNGYVYSGNNNKPKLKNMYFRCKNSSGVHECTARAIAKCKNLKEAKLTSPHSHLPHETVLEKSKLDAELDSIIESNKFMATRELYFKARENVPTDKVQFIPLRKSYNSFIHRRKKNFKPKNPKTIDEFDELINRDEFKERYCLDQRNNTFYRGVWTDKNGHRMIVFISETGVEFLKSQKVIEFLMDGTFKVLPRHIKFTQLYVMSFMYEERCYPFLFAFMEKRDTDAYDLLFGNLVDLITPECAARVSFCMSDYEQAVRNMCRKHFPNARIGGCFFHYVKAVNKRARAFGLSKEKEYQQPIREVCALALLPNEYVSDGFDVVVNKTAKSEKWTRFSNYWQRQWLPANISVYGLRNRTDNFSESFNRSFNLLNGKPHQNIWIVLKNLKQMEMDKTDQLLKHKDGLMFNTESNKITKKMNEKIRKATDRFNETEDIERFLQNITQDEDIQKACSQSHLLEDDAGLNHIENEELMPNDFDENSNFQAVQKQTINLKRKATLCNNKIPTKKARRSVAKNVALFRKIVKKAGVNKK